MGKFLLLLLAVFLMIPRLLRLLAPRRPASGRPRAPGEAARNKDELRDLTQQDISDADYEEIPPEE